ncbi:hypothetical protein DITRI_Ditri02bG0135000 [Diplodiscus trichospermus]
MKISTMRVNNGENNQNLEEASKEGQYGEEKGVKPKGKYVRRTMRGRRKGILVNREENMVEVPVQYEKEKMGRSIDWGETENVFKGANGYFI